MPDYTIDDYNATMSIWEKTSDVLTLGHDDMNALLRIRLSTVIVACETILSHFENYHDLPTGP